MHTSWCYELSVGYYRLTRHRRARCSYYLRVLLLLGLLLLCRMLLFEKLLKLLHTDLFSDLLLHYLNTGSSFTDKLGMSETCIMIDFDNQPIAAATDTSIKDTTTSWHKTLPISSISHNTEC